MVRKLVRNAYTDDGTPKKIRIYDSGEDGFFDRITVVFTGTRTGYQSYLAMSLNPFWPQGVCQHGESPSHNPIDSPSYKHLGRKITWEKLGELSADCQKAVIQDYVELWGKWTPEESAS